MAKISFKIQTKKNAILKTENQMKKRKKKKKENATNKIRGVHMRVYLKMYLICTHETWHELKEGKKKIARKNMPLVLNRR